MNAPDNIYIDPEHYDEPTEPIWKATADRWFAADVEYIRHDLYAAVEAERDELRRDHAAALRLVADLRFALGDDGRRMQPELIKYAKQLRARLDAACEWVPIAEADLRDGESVLIETITTCTRHIMAKYQGSNFYDKSGDRIDFSDITHIMRIKAANHD